MKNKTDSNHYKLILGNCTFNYIDLGSRGGLSDEWAKVGNVINVVLFEPEPKEAAELQISAPNNTIVIPKAVWDCQGEVSFHSTRNPSYSSVLKPDTKVLDGTYYYCRNFYEIEDKSQINVDVLEDVLIEHGVEQIDFLKIDIQGAENYIFNSLRNWKSITGVHTEAYSAKLYENGADISTTLHQLYQNNFQLYDIQTIAKSPMVEIDGKLISSKELLNARPKSGYKARSMVYDMLLFTDNLESLSRNDQDFLRRMIFVYCVYEYFDHALYLAVKAFKNKIFSEPEKEVILRSVKHLHKSSLSRYQFAKERFQSPSYDLPKR